MRREMNAHRSTIEQVTCMSCNWSFLGRNECERARSLATYASLWTCSTIVDSVIEPKTKKWQQKQKMVNKTLPLPLCSAATNWSTYTCVPWLAIVAQVVVQVQWLCVYAAMRLIDRLYCRKHAQCTYGITFIISSVHHYHSHAFRLYIVRTAITLNCTI